MLLFGLCIDLPPFPIFEAGLGVVDALVDSRHIGGPLFRCQIAGAQSGRQRDAQASGLASGFLARAISFSEGPKRTDGSSQRLEKPHFG